MRIHLLKRLHLWTVKRENSNQKGKKGSGFPQYPSIILILVKARSKISEQLGWLSSVSLSFQNTNMGIVEISVLFDWKRISHIIHYSTRIQWHFEMKIFFFEKVQNALVAKWSIKQLIQFDSSTQLVVTLKSTSSPYYEWKGKCKDYH